MQSEYYRAQIVERILSTAVALLSSRLWIFAIPALLIACAPLESPAARQHQAEQWAAAAGWQATRIDTGAFVLAAYEPAVRSTVAVLTIYIEGDGFAWRTPRQPSDDPSPRDPVALQLALRHPDSAAAWLGRPCQFTQPADWRSCVVPYWTDARFSEQVVAASDAAITELKRRRGAQRIELVGYSGGGAIAALVAARRDDVQRLITVAGNLDHRAWTQWHRVAPLRDSLDPVDYVAQLTGLPQVHWVGGRDTVVGRVLADSFAAHFAAAQRPLVCEIAEAGHAQGWMERWPGLLQDHCK